VVYSGTTKNHSKKAGGHLALQCESHHEKYRSRWVHHTHLFLSRRGLQPLIYVEFPPFRGREARCSPLMGEAKVNDHQVHAYMYGC